MPASRASTARSSRRRAQHPDAHLRNVTIFADAEVDRSPCGTGTAAVMAVLSEMGVLGEDSAFRAREHRRHAVHGTDCRAHATSASCAAIVPEIQGSAWITGEHTFLIDGDDPLSGLPAVRVRSSTFYFSDASFAASSFDANSCSTLVSSMLLPSIVTRNRLATTRLSSPSLLRLFHFSKPGLPPRLTDFS